MKQKKISPQVFHLKSIDSTNDYAKKILKEYEINESCIFWADYQTQGRGQINNAWESNEKKNLTFSIVFFPDFLSFENQFFLSKAVSLALIDYIDTLTYGAVIKWPNDILIRNQKLAGILIENTIQGNHWTNSIVGIGLNVNQLEFETTKTNPVSLRKFIGIELDLEEALNVLIDFILRRYEQLKSGNINEINRQYLYHLYQYKQFHFYKKNNQYFEAMITGISTHGQLLMEDKNGKEYCFNFKEIEFL